MNLVMYLMLFVIGSMYAVFKLIYVDRALSSLIMGGSCCSSPTMSTCAP